MPNPKPYRILSLDGGGIRGLITAIWLKELEDRLEAPLWKHFDLIAGTSTGAILACGISKGIEINRIIDLYVERGREVFPSPASRLWSRATRLFSDGISEPKYDGEGLNRVLRDIFRTTIFGSLKIKPTLVLAYNTCARRPVVFKSNRREYHGLRAWEICRASASAPTYFPAHVMQVGGKEMPLIDGGVVANNPTACAIAEGVRINSNSQNSQPCGTENFVVASFGTGQTIRKITSAEATEWGAVEWVVPLIDVLFDGSTDAVDYIARHLLAPENYFRFQTSLDDAYDDLDNADRTNINALIRLAKQYIESNDGQKKLTNLVAKLKGASGD